MSLRQGFHSMPRSRCSSLSCHTVLPEQEHTVLSSRREPTSATVQKQSKFVVGSFLRRKLGTSTYCPRHQRSLLSRRPTYPDHSFRTARGQRCSSRCSALSHLPILLSRDYNAPTDHLPNLDRLFKKHCTDASLSYFDGAKNASTRSRFLLSCQRFPNATD
jgi:hypothetical protein